MKKAPKVTRAQKAARVAAAIKAAATRRRNLAAKAKPKNGHRFVAANVAAKAPKPARTPKAPKAAPAPDAPLEEAPNETL